MPIGRNGDSTQSFPVEKYGLNGSHHILLEGCTYPPEKRSSMAQSVGPMTAMLCHIRTEEKYRKKWTDAAKRAMAHIPVIDEVLDMVKGRKASEIRGIMSLLADILLITTSRQAHRMFFPLSMFYSVIKMMGEGKDITADSGAKIPAMGVDTLLDSFNVSGNGGFYFYHLASQFVWEIEGEMTESMARQILFHSIFGTFKEDLSILKQITDLGTWNTREEMGGSFKKMTTCGKSVQVFPVALKYYSKLSSANMSGLLSSSYSQVSSLPVFSGARTQTFSDDFFEQLNKRSGTISLSKTIPQLTSTLVEILTELKEKLASQNKRLELGTVKWRKIDGMDPVEGGEEIDTVFVGTGKFFWGEN
ncbi:hypothetical protein WA026_010022, partial [Henosepilachna vigintioctopunctata]